MVGATGIEPVTPTMSTDAATLKSLETLKDFSGKRRDSAGTGREHEGVGAQTARKPNCKRRLVTLRIEVRTEAETLAEAKRIQEYLLDAVGQVAVDRIRITISQVD